MNDDKYGKLMKFNFMILFLLMMFLSSCFLRPGVVHSDRVDRQERAEVTSSKASITLAMKEGVSTDKQMQIYADASTDEMKTKTAGIYSRENHSLEALRDELDTLKGKVDTIGTATGAHTWNVLSVSTTLTVGHAYTFSITGSIDLTLPSLCTAGENIQITTTSSSGIKILANTSQKILYEGEQDAVTVSQLMTLKLKCFITDSKWSITKTSGKGSIYAGNLVGCGNAGNNCYDNLSATTALVALTPTAKYLEYIDTGNGNYIWKEKDGGRILKATGLDEWQMTLNSIGESFTTISFTDASNIAGRVCPDKVYMNPGNKFSIGNCLYYDNTNANDSLASAHTSLKWYYTNHSVCANKGMRLPTIYETTADQFIDGSVYYPLSDGTPGFAGIGYDPTKGVPSKSGDTMTGSTAGGDNYYWRWNGVTDIDTMIGTGLNIRCVLP